MSNQEDVFLKELLAAFRAEAEDHLGLIAVGLWELEKEPEGPKRTSILEAIYRDAHSLKGAARSVNKREIEVVCQSLENLFSASKRGTLRLEAEHIDAIHRAIDIIRLVVKGEAGQAGNIAAVTGTLESLVAGAGKTPPARPAAAAPAGGAPPPAAAPPDPARPSPPADTFARQVSGTETVRISVEKLDALFFQVEEMLAVKQAASQRAGALRDMESSLDNWKAEWSRIVSRLRLAKAPAGSHTRPTENKVAELIAWQSARMKALEDNLGLVARQADEEQRTSGRMIDELLEDVKKAIMLPASRVLHGYPKMVRDLCRSQGKEAEVVVEGGDIEVDKRILEEMKDPLTHLLRNCVDHGLETPAERKQKGKPAAGVIKISLSHLDSRHVQIVVADDGAGIDAAAVKAAALKAGLLTPADAERLSRQDTLMLIFQSAVSTSSRVSELSGRGLGLAIVREKTEQMGGRVSLETRSGQGTSFRIVLPLSLATFRGILVQAGGQMFVIPTVNVERVVRIGRGDLKSVENREAIQFAGQSLALARLHAILELPAPAQEGTAAFPAVVLAVGDRRLAVGVDKVIEEKEVLVKGLGKQLARVRNVGGATVLGSGAVVPILNPVDLVQSAIRSSGAGGTAAPAAESAVAAPLILLAEDSITSRMLLKNILQSSGYQVRAVVDGAEAWALLKTEPFAAVVSDVEMPRMDGFKLTAKIRADAQLANLPVILVTARESREDREHGIEAGASAYLVKSSFDQSNLLETLQRLL